MIELICSEINNYFEPNHGTERVKGQYSIVNGDIAPIDFLKNGQYFRIMGSTFNDGIYIYPTSASDLIDEEFKGVICPMNVPRAFIELVDKIKAFDEENKASAFTSESFGGYSYSKAVGSNGASIGWQEMFNNDLRKWRKC